MWKHIPTAILPPACVPRGAPLGTVFLEVVGEPQDLLRAAILNGTSLNLEQIKALMQAYGIAAPKPGTGSGKKGSVLKQDRLQALVGALFPDATPETRASLVAGIMGKAPEDFSEAPELLLKLTATVGDREGDHFKAVKQAALNELEVRTEKAKQASKHRDKATEPTAKPSAKPRAAPQPATGDEPAGSTAGVARAAPATPTAPMTRTKAPPEFVVLLPDVQGLYFKWQPQNRRTSVEFTSFLAATECAATPYMKPCSPLGCGMLIPTQETYLRTFSAPRHLRGLWKPQRTTNCSLWRLSLTLPKPPITATSGQIPIMMRATLCWGLTSRFSFPCSMSHSANCRRVLVLSSYAEA